MTTTSTSPVWFITGATSGIGQELVRQALAAGESVVAVARSTADLPGLTATPFLSNMKAAAVTHSDYDATVRGVYEAVSQLPASAFSPTSRRPHQTL
jgi:NAD(P)-dependent dehydrogenase (short-subunit alcohol dehydrogenase family)